MENLFYKTIVCSFLLLFSHNIVAQNKHSKEIKETHTLSQKGTLYLDNKYGDVFLNGWDKNTIEIVINIEATGKNEDKAKSLLNRIRSSIVATKNQVIIKSEISDKEVSFFNKYINKIDPFKNEKTNTSINYTIYLPNRSEVEVYNKYGDIIIKDWNGKLKAEVEHGDIRTTDSITTSNISVKYGRLKANTLHKSSVKLKDATLSVNNSDDLKIDSNGSEIKLDVINKLELYSNKDNIEINELNNVFGNIKYSTVTFNTIKDNVNFDIDLGELRILKFDTKAPIVNINHESSEIYINISETNFNFNAKLEQGVLRIPQTMQNIDSEVLDKKNKIRHIKATYGNSKKGTFVFTGLKGIIILKEL